MDGKFFYIDAETAAKPVNGECIVDAWWMVDPEKGLAFYHVARGHQRSDRPSPQCNANRSIAEMLAGKMAGGHVVRQVPVVFMSHAVKEMKRLQSMKAAPVPQPDADDAEAPAPGPG